MCRTATTYLPLLHNHQVLHISDIVAEPWREKEGTIPRLPKYGTSVVPYEHRQMDSVIILNLIRYELAGVVYSLQFVEKHWTAHARLQLKALGDRILPHCQGKQRTMCVHCTLQVWGLARVLQLLGHTTVPYSITGLKNFQMLQLIQRYPNCCALQ